MTWFQNHWSLGWEWKRIIKESDRQGWETPPPLFLGIFDTVNSTATVLQAGQWLRNAFVLCWPTEDVPQIFVEQTKMWDAMMLWQVYHEITSMWEGEGLPWRGLRNASNHMRVSVGRPPPWKEVFTFSVSPRDTVFQFSHLPPCLLQLWAEELLAWWVLD